MDFRNYFSYEASEIPKEIILQFTESDLDSLYAESNPTDRFNVYFHLENELHYLLGQEEYVASAYVCYLISYYLFTALTPPHSDRLALVFANRALELFPSEKYQNWLEEVKQGN